MSVAKKLFKWGWRVSLGIFVVLSLAFLAVWTWPQLLINRANVERLANLLRPSTDLSWGSLDIKAGSHSFFRKHLLIEAKDFCFRLKESGVDSCFSEVSIPLEIDIAHWVPHYHLGATKLLGGKINIEPKAGPEEKKDEEGGNLELPGFLKYLNLVSLVVGVDAFTLRTPTTTLKATAELNATEKDENIVFRFRGTGGEGKKKFKADISGDIGDGTLLALVTADAQNLADSLPGVGVTKCRITLTEQSLRTSCPASLKLTIPTKKPYTDDFAALIDLKVDLKRKDPAFKGKDSIGGNVSLNIEPVIRRVKEGRLEFRSRFDGEVAKLPNDLSLDSHLKFEIKDFRRVSWAMQKMPWGVPEPLNSLRGPITIQASAKGKLSPNSETPVPLKFETRLSSIKQRLSLDGSGELLLRRVKEEFKTHLKFQLQLSDVRLVLPRLEHKAPPRLAPDGRIKLRPEVARNVTKEPSFTYEIEILSPPENPIRLVSNLAGADIPVNLSLKLKSGEPADGIIRLGQFPVELFRRVASVDRFELRVADKPENQEINGRITIAYTDYTIRILILGLASEPHVKFLSEPPLPEDQVMAVLLFGKPIDDLDNDEAASVGSARAAVADSAVSLASMYLLASTPVESVGYDQTTGVFTAKIRLGDGTSLNLGSDTRSLNQLGVRKRLGPDWTVTTYLQNPLDPIERSLTAFLEWSKGY